jgi:hypothetical protein
VGGKRDRPEDVVLTLRLVEDLQGQGMAMADAVRKIGVTVQAYYRCRKPCDGVTVTCRRIRSFSWQRIAALPRRGVHLGDHIGHAPQTETPQLAATRIADQRWRALRSA